MNLFANRPAGVYPSPQLAQIELLKWKSKQVKSSSRFSFNGDF
jgi:hypothetical protein